MQSAHAQKCDRPLCTVKVWLIYGYEPAYSASCDLIPTPLGLVSMMLHYVIVKTVI